MGDDSQEDQALRGHLRGIFEPRARCWAEGRGLLALLRSLEADWPHCFALAAATLGDSRRPWEPRDMSEREASLAYKRATLHLHPDRLAGRDLSVQVEAEEVLKVLTHAHAAKETWFEETGSQPTAASYEVGRDASSSGGTIGRDSGMQEGRASAGDPHNGGGTGLRDEIFGGGGAAQARATAGPSPPTPTPAVASNPFANQCQHPPSFGSAASAADDLFRSAPSAASQSSADSSTSPGDYADLFRPQHAVPTAFGGDPFVAANHGNSAAARSSSFESDWFATAAGSRAEERAASFADELFKPPQAQTAAKPSDALPNLNDLFSTMPDRHARQ